MVKVLICGPLPEPVGGVSVHTKRLSELLSKNNITVKLCDESRQPKEKIPNIRRIKIKDYLKLVISSDIIHIHSSVTVFRLTHLLASSIFRKKTIVTIHSWRFGKLKSTLWTTALNTLCDKIIFVSQELRKSLPTKDSKSLIFPAFIPPQNQASPLPPEISDFIKNSQQQNKKIISSNAFRIVLHNGQDLYGLDICIEAFSELFLREKSVLVYVISDPNINTEKIQNYKNLILQKGLSETILIYCGAIDFYELIKISDMTIRATNTDGDALSIRESIYLGVPCVASDCVARPKGAITFKNRSASSLAKTISSHLNTHPSPPENDNEKIINFYKDLYRGV